MAFSPARHPEEPAQRASRRTQSAGPANLGGAIEQATAALGAAGLDEPRRRARRLVAAALGLSASEVFAHPERQLDRAERGRVDALLARMLAHEPISRIFG